MSARKAPEDRANREKVVYSEIPITWDGQTRGPTLPEDYDWCRMTRGWWQMIRNSAQASAFHPTDWAMLLDTAFLHQRYWGGTSVVTEDGREVRVMPKHNEATTLAAEIRRRCEPYGFSWADRRKYNIHIVTDAEVANAADQITRSTVNSRALLAES
jgi:hypothetical protein